MIRKLLDSARHQRLGVVASAVEVQVEPMRQFNLKADAHKVRPLLVGHIDYETARQIIQNIDWYLMVFFCAK